MFRDVWGGPPPVWNGSRDPDRCFSSAIRRSTDVKNILQRFRRPNKNKNRIVFDYDYVPLGRGSEGLKRGASEPLRSPSTMPCMYVSSGGVGTAGSLWLLSLRPTASFTTRGLTYETLRNRRLPRATLLR